MSRALVGLFWGLLLALVTTVSCELIDAPSGAARLRYPRALKSRIRYQKWKRFAFTYFLPPCRRISLTPQAPRVNRRSVPLVVVLAEMHQAQTRSDESSRRIKHSQARSSRFCARNAGEFDDQFACGSALHVHCPAYVEESRESQESSTPPPEFKGRGL